MNRYRMAASREYLPIMKLLVEAGASVNPPRSSPLYASAEKGDVAGVEYLLAQGADPKYFDGKQSPLGAAIRSGNVEVGRMLLAAGADANGTVVGRPIVEFGRSFGISPEFQKLLDDAAKR